MVDESGAPLGGIPLVLQAEHVESRAVTDDNGAFRFERREDHRFWWVLQLPPSDFLPAARIAVESKDLRLCARAPYVHENSGTFLGASGFDEPQDLGDIALCPAS